jgi:hypothetical protein
MAIDRLIDIYEELARHEHLGTDPPALCVVAAEFVSVSGAGIAIQPSGGGLTVLCSSDGVARELMELEVTLGEGPTVDASGSDAVVSEPDLQAPSMQGWISYRPLATAAGAAAVFAIPLRIGAIRLGVLTLFDDHAGSLSEAQSSDAHLMASVVCRALLALQAGAPADSIGDELLRQGSFDFSVHQAAGMVAVQGAMTVGEALARLRAHAFALNVSSTTLAGYVIYREVLFDPLAREWRETGSTTR